MNRSLPWIACVIILKTLVSPTPLPPIFIAGNVMYNAETGARFWMKGLTYGDSVQDDQEQYWKKSLELISAIPGLNTIRIYNINPPINAGDFHVKNSYDKFMTAAANAGIYVILPVTPPGIDPWKWCPLNRAGTPPLGPNSCYPSCLLTYGQAVINYFSKYTNTLAFVVGNEVMNSAKYWAAAPCVKGYTKDLKTYMRRCAAGMRNIPLMYAVADTPGPGTDPNKNGGNKADYLQCDFDKNAHVDMIAFNIYRWCTSIDTYETSGYKKLNDALKHSPGPLLFAEFGCAEFYWDPHGINKKGQRNWKQIEVLFGPNMNPYWAGGMAYSYGETGGQDFSMYTGGGSSPLGPAGYKKKCGFGIDPSVQCNVDNLATEFSKRNPDWPIPQGDICEWKPPNYNYTTPSCPNIPGIDLTMDVSRQDAPGYTKVDCVVYPLSEIEKKINQCIHDPTSGSSSGTNPTTSSHNLNDMEI